ncbi:MAG: T9SS type A sorting domain-containing protein [Psychroflexus sp.]|nr:T9SS type A sorting domain-containing protein [Psychroflexus sp.]MDN6310923.1 T9SS type A sorting domain-containing protein [Psychroflexus sp.]
MKTYHKLFLIFSFLICINTSHSQDFSKQWSGHFSYFDIRSLSTSSERVYAAAENAFFSYDLNSQTVEKVSSIKGLSGKEISAIHHSDAYAVTLVGYENGLIQLVMDNNQKVFTIVDIVNKQTISPPLKRINHFYEHEGRVLISTKFGVAVYDLENLEFGDSFFIGAGGSELDVKQTAVYNGNIYAATQGGGMRYAAIDDPDLVDYQVWQNIGQANWKAIEVFNNQLYALQNSNRLSQLNGTSFNLIQAYAQNVNTIIANEDRLVISLNDKVEVRDLSFNLVFYVDGFADINLEVATAVYQDGHLFIGDENLGLLKVSAGNQTQYESISPDGPILNSVFDLKVLPGELWLVYGEYDQFWNPYPLNKRRASHFFDEEWYNFDFDELDNARELSQITVDPLNPKRVFISSFFDGILEFEENQRIEHYDSQNSNLEGVASNANDVRIGGSVFDQQGNLYFTNAMAENPLKKMNSSGQISEVDVSDAFLSEQNKVTKIEADKSGNIYTATYKDGIIAYQSSTDTAKMINSGVDGVDFPEVYESNPRITALKTDLTSRLWIGTSDGLRVMYNPGAIFESNANVSVSPIIIEDVDGLAQELLFEQFITDIAVDGANNKWISTADSGVIQVSASGQEVLNQFTVNNSPLPTNSVRSVEVDNQTGVVYFGTTRGLISFSSKITSGQDNLENVRAFPNPVRPGYNGLVTIDGLTDNANVKITDISGNLVYEKTASGGSIQWDTRAFERHKVSSGVYLVLITGAEQTETQIAKIMIIR